MAVKCGKCSTWTAPVYHDTVADVRTCYYKDVQLGAPANQDVVVPPTPSSPDWYGKHKGVMGLELPFPSGRYAVVEDGVVKFYKVDLVTEGKWSGHVFVKVQASDDLFAVRSPSARKEILDAIAEDPESAMLMYGQELGKCGHCGRTLTDEDSRAAGIGPVCRRKVSF